MKACKKLISILIAISLTLSLVACGGADGAAEESAPTATSVQGSMALDEGDSSGAAAGDKVSLTLWQHEPTEQRVKAWNTVIDAFNASQPNIEVSMEVVLWEDAQSKMLNAIMSGTTPDMNVVSDTSWSSAYLADGLVPVDDIVGAIDAEYDLIDSSLKSFETDGHTWAVPMDSIVYSLMYKPSVLEAAGYSEPPKTWSELEEYAAALTSGDQYGIGITCARDALATDTFGAFLASAGTDLFDEEGNIVFDNEQTVKALTFYRDLYAYAPPAASGWSWGEIEMNWAAGSFAMLPYHAPNLAAFFENGDLDIASAPMVVPDDGGDSFKSGFNHAISVTKTAEENGHMDAVKEFLMFCHQPENSWILTVCMEPGFYLPVTQAAVDLVTSGYFDEAAFPIEGFDAAEGSEHRAILDNFLNVALESSANMYALGNKYGAVNSNLAEIYNSYIISDMMQKVLLEGEDPAAAVTWAQEQMEGIG